MPTFEHKKLIETIASLDVVPSDPARFSDWIEAGGHLEFLRHNAQQDEIVIFGTGEYSFIHAMAVSNDRLTPLDEEDLLGWSFTPYTSIASYVYGGGREEVWIEGGPRSTGTKTLDGAVQLVFGRTFEGWSGQDRTYFELRQEYAHLAGVHWRPEHRAYCRFDENGDIDPVVSVTMRQEKKVDATVVSFKWEPLEEYLAISNSSLVRMFDFMLLRRETFTMWPEGPDQVICEGDELFYRQKIVSGYAGYTRGVQIIRPRRPAKSVFTGFKDGSGGHDKRYVEFITHDWRNKRITNISTEPSATTNYFEAPNNTLPFELSPAFFRPEVLLKYKADRDKYTVGEREVSCRAAWSMRGFDVNQAGQVHAYICDLRDLPHAEQLHWLSYNEAPKAPMSERAVTSDFKGEFSSVASPLRNVLTAVQRWHDKRVPWWSLRDEKLVDRVSVPISASRDEWGEAFMDLSKLVVEGLDVAVIRARLQSKQIPFDAKEQSIVLLERLLNYSSGPEGTTQLAGLRSVQRIRSKVKGHPEGHDAEQLAQDALAKHESFASHFEHVCEQVAEELSAIEDLFMSGIGPAPGRITPRLKPLE